MKLLADNTPRAMKEQKFESYFGRKIAIDASMSIYQFLVWIIILAQYTILCRYAGFNCNVFFELYAVDCSGTKWDWDAHKWGWRNY